MNTDVTIINSSDKVHITNKKTLKEFLEYERQKYGRKNIRRPLICIGERSYLWKHNVLLRKTEYYINTENRLNPLIVDTAPLIR